MFHSTFSLAAVTLGASFVPGAAAAGTQEAPASVVRARHLEQVSHEPEEALEIYSALLASESVSADERAQSLLGNLRCLLKLGKSEEAQEVAGQWTQALGLADVGAKVSNLFSAYASVAGSGIQQSAASFQARIDGLIQSLGDQAAANTLRDLGENATPFLLAAVRTDPNPAIVNMAMTILADQAAIEPEGKAGDFFAALDQESDPVLIATALQSLSRGYPERFRPALDKLAQIELSIVKKPLIWLFAAKDERLNREYLRRMLDDPDHEVRWKVLKGIWEGSLPEDFAVELARKAAQDEKLGNELVALSDSSFSASVWLEACLSPHPRVRYLAFKNGLNQLGYFLHPLNEAQRRSLATAFVSLFDGTFGDFDGTQSLPSLFQPSQSGSGEQYTGDITGIHKTQTSSTTRYYGYCEQLPLTPKDLEPLLHSPDVKVSYLVIDWMLRRGDRPGAPEALIEFAKDADACRRVLHSNFLKETPPDLAHRISALALEHDIVRDDELLGVLQFLAQEPDDVSRSAVKAIFSRMDATTDRLVNEHDLRHFALFILTSSWTPNLDEPIVRLLSLEKPFFARVPSTRFPQGEDLLDHPTIVSFLQRCFLDDEDLSARVAALYLLTTIGNREVLLSALLDPRSTVDLPLRRDVLKWIGSQARDNWLGSQLTTTVCEILIPADGQAVPYVEDFLRRAPENIVQKLGGHVVSRLSALGQGSDASLREEIKALFLCWIKDGDAPEGVRHAAWFAVENLGPATDDIEGSRPEHLRLAFSTKLYGPMIEALKTIRERRLSEFRADVEKVLETGSNYLLSVEAVKTLESFLDPECGLALVRAMADPSLEVRAAAKEALDNLRIYTEEKERWEQFGAKGGGVLSPLTALVKQSRDPDKKIRLAAVKALGSLGDPAALPHLIEMLREQDEQIRSAAEKSIEQLSAPKKE